MARRLLLVLALFVSCLDIAFAVQQQTSYIAFGGSVPGAASGGTYVPQDYVNPGVIVHEGTVARFVCVELVETREGFTTMYAAATIPNGLRWYLKIVDIPEGLGSAMVGFTNIDYGGDHCGAGGIVPTNSVSTLKIALPDGS